jgi:alpha-tubulin suppressor-like RCC1 family protein
MRRLRLLPLLAVWFAFPTIAAAQVYHFGGYGFEQLVPRPTLVGGLGEPTAIDAGNASGYALLDGVEYAWGDNGRGQLGDGTLEGSETAVRVKFPPGVTITAIGEADKMGAAIDTSGQLWTWGEGGNQLCQGKDYQGSDILEPKQVAGVTTATQVKGGGHHLVWILANGTVQTCGVNNNGELGDSTGRNSATPVNVTGLTGIVEVTAGSNTTCARDGAGEAWDWGSDEWGQVGNGTSGKSVATPYKLPLKGVTSISCGGSLPTNGSNMALLGTTAYGWGSDAEGQLGDGGGAAKLTPTVASEVPALTQLVTAGESSLGLTTTGEVLAWGSNERDALGQGVSARRLPRSLKPLAVAHKALEISATATNAVYRAT